MSERERMAPNHTLQPSSGGGNGDENLERIRRTADEFLSAGDDAIRRALSVDSEDFLRANRQHGGQ
jgi:hypothetical protein